MCKLVQKLVFGLVYLALRMGIGYFYQLVNPYWLRKLS